MSIDGNAVPWFYVMVTRWRTFYPCAWIIIAAYLTWSFILSILIWLKQKYMNELFMMILLSAHTYRNYLLSSLVIQFSKRNKICKTHIHYIQGFSNPMFLLNLKYIVVYVYALNYSNIFPIRTNCHYILMHMNKQHMYWYSIRT